MRLLQLGSSDRLTLTKDILCDIPAYAILSHTWGKDDDEVAFEDIAKETYRTKSGYQKIVHCGREATKDKLDYFWVDTCCINKESSADLEKSINSMFAWYKNAAICYVYLEDVSQDGGNESRPPQAAWQPDFKRSKWFTRGWTLQELLAPMSVKFLDRHGWPLGNKAGLARLVQDITGIPEAALLGTSSLMEFQFSERYEWARNRHTKLKEDWAYSLQGIFGVTFKPHYKEGRAKAVQRLVNEIKSASLNMKEQSLLIKDMGRTKILDPILLDIAFLETMSIIDDARLRAIDNETLISETARQVRVYDNALSDIVSVFFTTLRHLLRFIAFPMYVLRNLELRLEEDFGQVHHLIKSRRRELSKLQDMGDDQTALAELRIAQEFLQLLTENPNRTLQAKSLQSEDMEVLKKGMQDLNLRAKTCEEAQQIVTGKVEKPGQQDDAWTCLIEKTPDLLQSCYEGEQMLGLSMRQKAEQRAQIDAQQQKLEAKLEEAERLRKWENKGVLEKIWGWIKWVSSCGSVD